VLLPIAVFCSYQALQYHNTSVESRELAVKWSEIQHKHDALGTAPTFDARVEAVNAYENAYAAESKRVMYIFFKKPKESICILFQPLLSVVRRPIFI
jgi:hypothetical protein